MLRRTNPESQGIDPICTPDMYGGLGASGCRSAAQKGFRGVSCDHQTESFVSASGQLRHPRSRLDYGTVAYKT